jgi:hypothetical protein
MTAAISCEDEIQDEKGYMGDWSIMESRTPHDFYSLGSAKKMCFIT